MKGKAGDLREIGIGTEIGMKTGGVEMEAQLEDLMGLGRIWTMGWENTGWKRDDLAVGMRLERGAEVSISRREIREGWRNRNRNRYPTTSNIENNLLCVYGEQSPAQASMAEIIMTPRFDREIRTRIRITVEGLHHLVTIIQPETGTGIEI